MRRNKTLIQISLYNGDRRIDSISIT